MFKTLVDLTGFEAFGIATTVFFFLIFIAIVTRAFLLKRSVVAAMEQLPLEHDDGNEIEDKEQ